MAHASPCPSEKQRSFSLQLDSLVRIGASMQSPDQHLQGPQGRRQSPVEMVQQLLPPGLGQAVAQLDSSINPLQSNANAQAFLTELHAEWLRQSCGGGLEGKGGPALGGQAGSQLPGGYDFYLDSKFPGAGTWVRSVGGWVGGWVDGLITQPGFYWSSGSPPEPKCELAAVAWRVQLHPVRLPSTACSLTAPLCLPLPACFL